MAENKKTTLDAVNAAISSILSGGAVQEYSINGRSIRKISLNDLIKFRNQLQNEIAMAGNTRTYAQFNEIR